MEQHGQVCLHEVNTIQAAIKKSNYSEFNPISCLISNTDEGVKKILYVFTHILFDK